MLKAFFMFTKWWEFTQKNHLVTSLIFILKFSKELDNVYYDLKD
jgi:hypothetical protein